MLVAHIITGLNDGGAESSLYRLVTNDHNTRHIIISMMDQGKYGPKLQEVNITTHCLNMPRGRLTLTGLFTLWRILRSVKPDTVQTWMYHADLIGGVIARLAGIRNVVWGIRNTTLDTGKAKLSTIQVAKILARLSYWIPRRIIVCAQKSVEVHNQIGYDTRHMVVIPNGYDLSQLTPNSKAKAYLCSEWNIPDSSFIIGMVARFDPYKDHLNLINALKQLDSIEINFQTVLIGTGVDTDNTTLMQAITAKGLNGRVHLLGARSDIPFVMNALDIHVLSSSAEAFPNVLAEAMACGTPCITTDVGDAALIVGNNGWVVPSSDSKALAKAIFAAIQEKSKKLDTWQARKQAARQQVMNNFSIERMVSAYNQAWQEEGDK